MADLADVENALVSASLAVLYPGGMSDLSVTGSPIRVYRGWPMSNALGKDLAAQICNVSVMPMAGTTHNTTRWPPLRRFQGALPGTQISASGNAVTVGGAPAVGDLVGVLADNTPVVYAVKAGDTPAVVAAMLAEEIRAFRTCFLAGMTFTLPGVARLLARAVGTGVSFTEWGRQEQGFRVTLWCPNPALRDLVASALVPSFAATAFLTLSDGSSGRLRYVSTDTSDDDQNGQLYRRDLIYSVEYGTIQSLPAPEMLFGDTMIAGNATYG